jgi:ABC-2 type transport system ATP-binding protein
VEWPRGEGCVPRLGRGAEFEDRNLDKRKKKKRTLTPALSGSTELAEVQRTGEEERHTMGASAPLSVGIMLDSLAIQTHDLSKTYRDGWFGRRRVQALAGVSLSVNRGEIFGLLGPNGAGKTTLIKVLLGLVHKTSGEAQMLGRPAGHRSTRRQIGYLPEHHRLPHHLTGNTALEYYGGLSNMPLRDIRRRRSELLAMVGLSRWGKTLVRKYSKGMLQRLGLAQAMLHNPDLLILDEPTDGVDPVGRAEIREVLGRLKSEGKTIFLNSHLLQEVELVCDRVAILGRGRLRRMDTVDALRRQTSPEAVLTLRADEPSVRRLLNGRPVLAAQVVDGDLLRITVEAPDQPALDRWIDLLRAGGVSIAAVARRQVTLEQVFLDLVLNDDEGRPDGRPDAGGYVKGEVPVDVANGRVGAPRDGRARDDRAPDGKEGVDATA